MKKRNIPERLVDECRYPSQNQKDYIRNERKMTTKTKRRKIKETQ